MIDEHHTGDFTRLNFRRLVRMAKAGYTFRRFTDFHRGERFILWRHDVDMSVHAARRLAEIEADEGVTATYFLFLHGAFYNLFEPTIMQHVREIAALGHDLGLHFDTRVLNVRNPDELEIQLNREKRVLEEFFEKEILAFSFHDPGTHTNAFRAHSYAGMVNAYSDYFLREVSYVSDSNGYWRHRRLEDVLLTAGDARLQVLTHPEWWQDAAMAPRQRVERSIDGRAAATRMAYDEYLDKAGRKNVRS